MTTIAIDAPNFAFKQHRAGRNTATAMVQKARGALTHFRDAHVYLCYDSKPTFRHDLFPQYKGNRTPSPVYDQVNEAIEESKVLARAAGVHVVCVEKHEADDVLASIARQCRVRHEPCLLVSTDRDMFPLLMYDGVELYQFIADRGHHSMLGMKVDFVHRVREETIIKKYGVECWQWIDYRCMVGDESDNIKGLKGYGEKKARLVLDAFDTLDKMFGDWDTNKLGFNEREQERFEAFRDELPTLRQLFRLVDSLDVLRH